MAASALWIVDITRDGEYLTGLRRGVCCGGQGAALKCCLDHQCAVTQSTDYAIAAREMSGQRISANRKLGYDNAVLSYFLCELLMSCRIYPIQSGGGDSDGIATGRKRSTVCAAIDSMGQSTGHSDAVARELGSQFKCVIFSAVTGFSATDNCHLWSAEYFCVSAYIEHQWRVGYFQQQAGILR